MKTTPIFINAKDRVTYLRRMIDRLKAQGYHNLYVVDTGSSWPSMIAYELSCPARVFSCQPGASPQLALWSCGVLESSGHGRSAFVYTDCDILTDCPDDWLAVLYSALDQHPEFPKAGLGLRIDDIPDHYSRKREVIAWEGQFWNKPMGGGLFEADIDTTLALHRPGTQWSMKAIRTGGDYQARHLPWYENSSQPSEEQTYYKSHMMGGVGHWR